MRRREFITLLGSAAAAWPLAVRAQQAERMRRIGMLINLAADDPVSAHRIAAFAQGLQEAGWTVGRNVRVDYRWSGGVADTARRLAAELVALAPDVIVTAGASHVTAVLQASRTIPIVFYSVTDPVGGGLIASMARPGGSATGFILFEFSMSAKWLELLKQIAPGVTRAAVIRDPSNPTGTGQFGAIQSMAPSLRIELFPVDVRSAGEIERGLAEFARAPNGGLIVTANPLASANRDAIISLAARHRLPAVYSSRDFVANGGLASYAPDADFQARQAGLYVARILNGEKPGDLPVQAPTKFELVINLKTAKELGLQVPDLVLVRADEAIE
jgi:putative ABC transport system substrate-binding protein